MEWTSEMVVRAVKESEAIRTVCDDEGEELRSILGIGHALHFGS